MDLLFLHGAPASGKLTVAEALTHAISCRLFDNHSAINVAKTVLDFGEPGFWQLTRDVRLDALRAAALQNVPLVITTFCYTANAVSVYSQIEALIHEFGGTVFPAFLHCSAEETEKRIGNQDRIEKGKLSSMNDFYDFGAGLIFTPVERSNCLSLDTSTILPDITAQTIINYFGLKK